MAHFLSPSSRTIFKCLSLAAVVAVGGSPGLASAAKLNDGYVGCISKEALSEFNQALTSKDEKGMRYLIGRSCVLTNSKLQISVLDRGIMTTKYRVYIDDGAVELYSPSEAISF
nr:hypothetical protein [uncultured Pseudomonas sp.]